MTTKTATKTKEQRYPTTVRCCECGGPVYAQNEWEQQLIQRWPKDGFWVCLDCRPGKGKGR